MEPLFERLVLALLDFVSSTRRIAALYVANFFFCTIVFMIEQRVALIDALW